MASCHCEKSVLATCDICGERGQISPSTGLCIICMTGESDNDRAAVFILHDIKCPLSDYVKKGARK